MYIKVFIPNIIFNLRTFQWTIWRRKRTVRKNSKTYVYCSSQTQKKLQSAERINHSRMNSMNQIYKVCNGQHHQNCNRIFYWMSRYLKEKKMKGHCLSIKTVVQKLNINPDRLRLPFDGTSKAYLITLSKYY